MIKIAVVSQKGGAGKTTLAIHLGVVASRAGYVTCLIDTDPQATAAAWGDWRQGKDPEVITCPPPRLAKTLEDARELGAEVVIIDTPPHADAAAREAVRVADLVLIPCRPRAFDLHAIATTADLVKNSGRQSVVVFNATPSRARVLRDEARQVVESLGLQVAPVALADRAAYHAAAANGKTAFEVEANGRGSREIEELWEWIAATTSLPAKAAPASQNTEAA